MSIFARISGLAFVALTVSTAFSFGAEPSPTPKESPLANIATLISSPGELLPRKMFAAEEALLAGLPSLAERLSRDLLEDRSLSNAERNRLLLTLSGAQIANGDYEAAAKTLEEIPGDSSRKKLREAFVAISRGDAGTAAEALSVVDPQSLFPVERPWFFFVRALAKEFLGDKESAEADFKAAAAVSPRMADREDIEFARHWASVVVGSGLSEAELLTLKARCEASRGTPEYAKNGKLYIVALAKSGNRAGALEALKEISPIPAEEAADFALLEGLLTENAGSDAARQAFERVIALRPSRDRQSAAFSGLRRNVFALWQSGKKDDAILAANSIEKFLTELKPDGKVSDLELFTRARIAYEVEDLHSAKELAEELTSRFPASPFVQDALRLQIGIAEQKKEYRRAVALLERLRRTELSAAEMMRTDVLIADYNFLSGDYALAADAYARAAASSGVSEDELGILFFQQALSEIRGGDVVAAMRLLDSPAAVLVSPGWTMRTECVVIEALKQSGRILDACARAEKFLQREDLLPDFRIRILWIEALLALELGDSEKAFGNAEQIEHMVSGLGDEASPELKQKSSELLSRVCLLKARALFLSDNDEAGLKQLADLRERYPESTAAVVSWLEEGRRFNEVGKPARALVCYETVADRYGAQDKFAEYIAIAIFEAAQAAATIGRPEEAVKQMQQLVSRYPKSSLAFYARLRQADFFRILNDFDSALSVYDNILATSANRPEMRIVEIRRADVLRAIAARADADKATRSVFDDAQAKAEGAYERLYSLPNQPLALKAEAGFKWAYAVEHSVPASEDDADEKQQAAAERARTLYWKTVTDVLDAVREQGGTNALGASGGYWVSRCLFALAASYESSGDFAEARAVYENIIEWGKGGLIPGKNYAETRRTQIIEK